MDPLVSHLVDPVAAELKGEGIGIISFDYNSLPVNDSELPPETHKGFVVTDLLTFIYTSGTTGLPKATTLPRNRHIEAGYGVSSFLRLKPEHVWYTVSYYFLGAVTIISWVFTVHNIISQETVLTCDGSS